MIKRLTVGALLLAALGLFAGACGSDDAADETTTTKKETTTTEAEDSGDDSEDDASSDEISDDEYMERISIISEQISSANGDVCVLLDTLTMDDTDLPEPATAAQVEASVELFQDTFYALADAAPAGLETQAEAVRTAIDTFAAEAADNDFDPAWAEGTEPFSDPESEEALTTYFTSVATECIPMDGTETTVAG
jgi:hypothetical protein